MKKVKPNFVVKAAWFSDRVKFRWRNPRGLHSAIRQKYRGKPVLVEIGYGSPREVRGLHSSGLKKVIVHNLKELEGVDPLHQGAVISSTVGMKKRLQLLQLAQQKKIRILSSKDMIQAISKIQDSLIARKKDKEDRLKSKSSKQEEKKKKAEEKKKKDIEEKNKEKKSEEGVEDKIIQEQEKQKEIVDKTIIKKQ